MKKILFASALCATLFATYSCGGGSEKAEATEPAPDAVVWADTMTFEVGYLGNANNKIYVDVQGYGADGKLALVDKFEMKDGKCLKIGQIIYKNGQPVYGKDFEGDKIVGTDVFTYDANGNLTEEVQSVWDSERNKVEPSVKYAYTYDANGNVTAIKESTYANLRWNPGYEWTYIYDEQGRVTERKDYTSDSGDRRNSCWYTYKWNGQNQLEQLDFYFYDIKKGKLKHDSKTLYTYNAAGQVTEETVMRHKNTTKREDVNSRLYIKEYNDKGQLTAEATQRWRNNTWNAQDNKIYTYDEAGRLKEAQFISAIQTNKGMHMDKTTYSYPAGSKTPAAAAAPAPSVKPVINLEDKHLTTPEDE